MEDTAGLPDPDVLAAHAFLRQRLALVEQRLAKPDRESFSYFWGRIQRQTSIKRQWTTIHYRPEAHLLRKLLAKTHEGQALTTLRGWRYQLGEFLTDHRRRHLKMQSVRRVVEDVVVSATEHIPAA